MPEFLADAIQHPTQPLAGIVMSVLLWLLWRAVDELKTNQVSATAAQQALANAVSAIAAALQGVGDNVERAGETSTELIRMHERSTTAQTERHLSNQNLLNMIFNHLDRRGRT